VKEFANGLLPKLKAHLEKAKELSLVEKPMVK
jgi:hypothetical protein